MPGQKKILIIDDETDLCLLLKDYFLRKDYDVFVSHTLKEGEKAIETVHPDILFLDNNLPDGLGWENAHSIAISNPSTYIVLISAFHPSVPVMPVNSQFVILEKPIRLSDLDKKFGQPKNN